MRRWLLLIVVAGCGRTDLAPEPDGGDAGLADAGREEDAGASCVLTPPAELLTFGPRIAVPLENPKLLDGVMTPAGRVFAILDPMNTRVLLVGPTWQRELVESTPELARVHLAFNGAQFAVTWQAGQRLRFALFDVQGNPQHQRTLTTTTQADEAVVGFAGGTWVPVWTHGLGTIVDAWATRIDPDGSDQTLAQKVTSLPLPLGNAASGVSALVDDAGIRALVLAESSALAFTDSFPSHLFEISMPGSRGRGALVDMGDAGVSAVFFGPGPNSRRPDLLRADQALDGGVQLSTIATQPSLFSVQDVTAARCGRRLVVAYTDDTTGAGPCLGNYCDRPLLRVVADLDGGDWHSPATDAASRPHYARSVTILRDGDSLDVAWLSVSADGGARVMVAPSLIACCD